MLITLYKYDRRGRIWYYTLDDRQQSLFGQHTITVSWGMDLFSGTQKQYSFDTLEERDKKIREIIKQKSRTYKVLYSYFKDKSKNKTGTQGAGNSRYGIAGAGSSAQMA
ncbi:hypothetical protein [Spirochaeta lutea]|uniref:hypothetical protein n=1 Tax=Spirochaeta lutea TaxID=1480694 RepID=UPI00068BCAD5|nr:hypothetical protein [Spirochaeta lutea]